VQCNQPGRNSTKTRKITRHTQPVLSSIHSSICQTLGNSKRRQGGGTPPKTYASYTHHTHNHHHLQPPTPHTDTGSAALAPSNHIDHISSDHGIRVCLHKDKQVALVAAADPQLIVQVGDVQLTHRGGRRRDGHQVEQLELLELHLDRRVREGGQLGGDAVVEGGGLLVLGLEVGAVCGGKGGGLFGNGSAS